MFAFFLKVVSKRSIVETEEKEIPFHFMNEANSLVNAELAQSTWEILS